jgi:hypothetical protein
MLVYVLFLTAVLVLIYLLFDAILVTSPAFKICYATFSILIIGLLLI